MAQYQLGSRYEAQVTLRELSVLMKNQEEDGSRVVGNSEELRTLAEEAEALINPVGKPQ